MSTSKRSVLITGATGQQGGAVVSALLADSRTSSTLELYALSRNPESSSAQKLAAQGVTVLKGSTDSKDDLLHVLKGIDGAFLVTTPYGKEGVKNEVKQGVTFVDAASDAGVSQIVFTSVDGAERQSGVPHFDSKYEIEQRISKRAFAYSTILRPVAFCDNFPKQSSFASFMTLGLFGAALRGKSLQLVAVRDIGIYAARALLEPDVYSKKSPIALAGDELTVEQMQDAYANVQGGKRPWKAWLPSWILYLLPFDIRAMFQVRPIPSLFRDAITDNDEPQWFYTDGYTANISALKSEHAGLLTFEGWLREQNKAD